MSRSVRLLVLLALLGLCLPTAAQLSEKQAGKALKTTLVSARKTFQAELKAQTKAIGLVIKDARSVAKAGGADLESAKALFDELIAYQVAMVTAARDATAAYPAVSALLDELTPSEDPTAPVYPKGFLFTDGGALDAFATAVSKAFAKPYAKLNKKLAGYASAAEKSSGLFVSVRLLPALGLHEAASNGTGDVFSMVLGDPVTIDVVMGLSLVDEPSGESNVILVAGNIGGDYSLVLDAPGSLSANFADLGADGRYRAETPGFGVFPRGNYGLSVTEQEGGASARAVISLR
jgi:hypothetical protein